MRKQLLNECRITLDLQLPRGSRVLVAEGEPEKRGQKDQQVTVSVRDNGRAYLPGSSLKGVFRSRGEYIANVIKEGDVVACHLFSGSLPEEVGTADPRLSCGQRFRLRINAADRGGYDLSVPERYRDACPICQLFGHTFWAGRIRFTDFTVQEATEEERPHVAIDRITSGAAGGKLFKKASIVHSRFQGQVVVDNFSLWQLGLLGMLLWDLEDGLLRVGHDTTTGAGQVEFAKEATSVRLRSLGPVAEGRVAGLGSLLDDSQCHQYGYAVEDTVSVPGVSWQRQGLWQEALLEGQAADALWQTTHSKTVEYFYQFSFPQSMEVVTLYQLREGEEGQE